MAYNFIIMCAFLGLALRAAPTELPRGNDDPRTSCGTLSSPSGLSDMYTTVYCSNIDSDESWTQATNNMCTVCMFFASEDCMDGLTWWLGPGYIDESIPSSKSYLCTI
jgi:hypothetical protein